MVTGHHVLYPKKKLIQFVTKANLCIIKKAVAKVGYFTFTFSEPVKQQGGSCAKKKVS